MEVFVKPILEHLDKLEASIDQLLKESKAAYRPELCIQLMELKSMLINPYINLDGYDLSDEPIYETSVEEP